MKSKVNSTLSRQNQKPHEKDLVFKKKKKKKKQSIFIWPVKIIEKQQKHFNFRIPLFLKFVKHHPLIKVKVIKVFKDEKRGNKMVKVQDICCRTQLF